MRSRPAHRSTNRRCPSSTRSGAGPRGRRALRARERPGFLEWALERFHPKMAISAAGGVDGMAIVDMAWRSTRRSGCSPWTPAAFRRRPIRSSRRSARSTGSRSSSSSPSVRRGDRVRAGPNLMYHSVDLRLVLRDPQGGTPEAEAGDPGRVGGGFAAGAVEDRRSIAKVELDRDHGGIVKLNPLADWTSTRSGTTFARTRSRTTSCSTTGTPRSAASRAPAPSPGEDERAGRWWWEPEPTRSAGSTARSGCSGGTRTGKGARRRARVSATTALSGGRPARARRRPGGAIRVPGDAGTCGSTVRRDRCGRGTGAPARQLLASGAADVVVVAATATTGEDPMSACASIGARGVRDLDGAFLGVASSATPDAWRDRGRGSGTWRARERERRHPALRLRDARDRASRRPVARDRDRRRLARPRARFARSSAIGSVRTGRRSFACCVTFAERRSVRSPTSRIARGVGERPWTSTRRRSS